MTDDRDHDGGVPDGVLHDSDELDLVVCPECAAPAEVADRFDLGSTDGRREHVKIQCLGRHWFLMPVTMLRAPGTVATPSGTRPVR